MTKLLLPEHELTLLSPQESFKGPLTLDEVQNQDCLTTPSTRLRRSLGLGTQKKIINVSTLKQEYNFKKTHNKNKHPPQTKQKSMES